MRARLHDDELRAYRAQGFVVVPDLLDAGDLDRWRAATERAAQARLALGDRLSNERGPADYRKVFRQVSGLIKLDDELRSLLLDPRIGSMAAALMGAERVRVWNDQALCKPPYGNATNLHVDAPYWSFTDPRALTLWVALDDATEANGCMAYLAGSHDAPRGAVTDLFTSFGAIVDAHPELQALPCVTAPVPAGGAVWHNVRIVHGAGANVTNRPRRAMTCAYMPDGVTYNGVPDAFVYPKEVVAAMVVGQTLDDERFNPLVPLGADEGV